MNLSPVRLKRVPTRKEAFLNLQKQRTILAKQRIMEESPYSYYTEINSGVSPEIPLSPELTPLYSEYSELPSPLMNRN